jgi:hypothetical protein
MRPISLALPPDQVAEDVLRCIKNIQNREHGFGSIDRGSRNGDAMETPG